MALKDKRADVNTFVWIAFLVFLALVLLWLIKQSGILQSQAWASFKQKIFPFG